MENNENTNFSLLNITDMRYFAGWATFNAVIDIIVGAISCIGIITAAYGIPMILAGIKLLNASDELKRYIAVNDTERISVAFYNLYKYFKLTGISLIVRICFIVLILVLYGALIAVFISRMPEIMDYFPGNYTF